MPVSSQFPFPRGWMTRRMYGSMYGMEKTTVYLQKEQLAALRRLSRGTGRPMAELIRRAIDEYGSRHRPGRRPRIGLFRSGRDDISCREEEILARGLGRSH